MKKKLKPFEGEGNRICKRCKNRDKESGLCHTNPALITRTIELEEATKDNPLEYKRLDSYWGWLIAMSELNECDYYILTIKESQRLRIEKIKAFFAGKKKR